MDAVKAVVDADALYAAGARRWGTDEASFIRLMTGESRPYMAAMFEAYERKRGQTIEEVLRSELSGDFLDGMLAIGMFPDISTNTPKRVLKPPIHH